MLLQRDWVCCWFISLYVGKEFSFRGGGMNHQLHHWECSGRGKALILCL
ncbi:hypothetical protein OTSANNIE_0282 [Anaplasma phagocytophilum str. Annie]|nr:hypothetical protein OTSANNIE_0282 [Anaplasma phagocytophilum str. Annie]